MSRRKWKLKALALHALLAGALGLSLSPGAAAVTGRDATTAFQEDVRPLLDRYCLGCHSTKKHKGDLDLEQFATFDKAMQSAVTWQHVSEQLANGEMPPAKEAQPSDDERRRLQTSVALILEEMAVAQAGDPGPVMLRRLNNAEYTYTIRDLTGVDSLDPAREFPVDSAAGEGFRNAGNALVMSPSLITKYLDAGKAVASHAVLLEDGLRFSPYETRRDWTEEILTKIRTFYRQFTDPTGGDKVNLQGIVFDTNEGGRLPLEKYFAATLRYRALTNQGNATLETIAREGGLSPKYLRTLWTALTADNRSLLLEGIRARWRTAEPADAAQLSEVVAAWQKALWKFASVGHIGKAGGPKAWLEPVTPLASRQELRFKVQGSPDATNLTLYLVAADAGDGNTNDVVVWTHPRIVSPGRPDLLIKDLRAVTSALLARRERMFSQTASLLAATTNFGGAHPVTVMEVAARYNVETNDLATWVEYLGVAPGQAVALDGHLTNALRNLSGYDFIRGWGKGDTPNVVANSSDEHVRIPGNMKPHSVAMHPSPKLRVAVGWQSPIDGRVEVSAQVTPAHPECGNGISWGLELRRGARRQRLSAGTAQGGKTIDVHPDTSVMARRGDVISLWVGARDGNHSCDLTQVELAVSDGAGGHWSLSQDVAPDVAAGNPHADRFGNNGTWHFYTEPDKATSDLVPIIPAGSLLAKWQSATNATEQAAWAEALARLLVAGPPADRESPDGRLYRQLASLKGPFFAGRWPWPQPESTDGPSQEPGGTTGAGGYGIDPEVFLRPGHGMTTAGDPVVHAPSVVEVRLPPELVVGGEFVVTGMLQTETGHEGSVQLQVLTNRPVRAEELVPSGVSVTSANGMWTDNNQRVSHTMPILVEDGSAARKRMEAAFDEFRQLFPAALCYAKIVPVDEVVTLTLFHREDSHLARLMLDDAQKLALDRMWDEFHFVSQDALTLVDAYDQLWQFATQDADPKVFEPLRQPIRDRAEAFRKRQKEAEPHQLDGVLRFARQAYRRPLSAGETSELRRLYDELRAEELAHEDAIRLMLTRILVAPAFLYRLEAAGPGAQPTDVSNVELANRLSYFLWSTMPDEELSARADAGQLTETAELLRQTRRMLRDGRVRRLATEFACQWLHIHGFDSLDEKSERHFPTFGELRGAMYEESILFFMDLFQRDGSVLDILSADHTFVNGPLARHYGLPGVEGAGWRKVSGVRKFSRGGVLGQASILSKQSGASRTSPILRGNWVAETLLGDRLPRPPKDVPQLPEDEAAQDLTMRELTERHTADPRCSGCHARIDPFGYALEGFDAVGRLREKDLGDRAIDTRTQAKDGAHFSGIHGLRDYLAGQRREDFVNQFCRKLLGYALGRAVQLSDRPLLTEMRGRLEAEDYRIGAAVEAVVASPQFRQIRGRDFAGATGPAVAE